MGRSKGSAGNEVVPVSVVVIGLNEEANLRRCFLAIEESLANASPEVARAQVIFVDSGSTDRSVEIAQEFADRILRLVGAASAAAAREAGIAHSTGEFVLLLDGDMEVAPGWIRFASAELSRSSPRVVGITGIRNDRFVDADGRVIGERPNVYRVTAERVAPNFGGAFFARRAVFETVGSYNPALKAWEEADLYARILQAGLQVREVPEQFLHHYTPRRPPLLRRLWTVLNNRYFGLSLYCSIRHGYFGGFLRVHRYLLGALCVHAVAILILPLNPFAAAGLEILLVLLYSLRAKLGSYFLAPVIGLASIRYVHRIARDYRRTIKPQAVEVLR